MSTNRCPKKVLGNTVLTVSKWKQPKGPSTEPTKGLWESHGVMRTVLNKQPMTAYSNTDPPLKQTAEQNKPDTCHEILSDDMGVRSKNRHN